MKVGGRSEPGDVMNVAAPASRMFGRIKWAFLTDGPTETGIGGVSLTNKATPADYLDIAPL